MKNTRLFLAGIVVGILLCAVIAGFTVFGQRQARRIINLPTRNPQLPFSDGVMVGNTLYLAGRLGTDPKTSQIPADVDQEIKFLLDGFKDVLTAAGMTPDDLVTVTLYCPDLTLYDKFNATYRTYFKKDFPARAFIGSGPLLRGAHFEIQGIAAK
ncbi:MAG: RidA family protein [Acidobacteria bacterium]|nr:RidA family protein [Acidobacteriota bacterium]